MNIRINLNDNIKYRITLAGWRYLARVNETDPIYQRVPKTFSVDEGGWTREQLWSMIQFWGPAISFCGASPIETEILMDVR